MTISDRAGSASGKRADELEEARAEAADLRGRLTEVEQELAELPELRQRSAELDRITGSFSWRAAELMSRPARPFRRGLAFLRGTAVGRIAFRLVRALRD